MKAYTIYLPTMELLAPDDGLIHSIEELKEYALSHYKDEILQRMNVKFRINDDSPTVSTMSNNKVDDDQDHMCKHSSNMVQMKRPMLSRSIVSPCNSLGSIAPPKGNLSKKLDLLNTIARVQRQFFQSESPKIIFGTMLDALLDLLDSEYGFIGEIKYDEDGTKYLQEHAITNISWNDATRKLFEENHKNGLVFRNLNSLFGSVITTALPVISNNPKKDKRSCGIPHGHPPLDYFLGIPFFMPGGEMNGMVGISNKPGGYTTEDIEFLEPFTVTCGNLINAFNQIKQNKYLINTLEESVKKRTHELEQANVELAEANRLVLEANKKQLQHFACMSHEIRTPLNCVVGMASVLKESKMAPLQQEAVEMVVSSGDLLLSIINDVLDYSKLETEKVNVHVQRTNLQDTITLVLNSIKSKAHPSQSIRSSFDIDIPELVHTDSRRLQQILFNLLGNAIKFSPDNGTIKLCLKMLSAQNRDNENNFVDVDMENSSSSWSSNNNYSCTSGGSSDTMMTDQDDNNNNSSNKVSSNGKILRFIVEDNGKGIDKKDLKRIFQPFQQASSTAENIYGGTGLGLSITQKLVKALNGNIRVESKKGEWSKFIVDFPFTDAPVNVLYKSQQVSNYVLHIVGLDESEKVSVMDILSAYNIYTSFFTSMLDMMNAVRTTSVLPDQAHICLVHEDHFDDNLVESLSDSVILTFGPKFSANHERAAFHFRSFHHILPSYFVNHLIRCVEEKKQQQNNMTRDTLDFSKAEVKAYTEMKILIAEDNVVNQKVLTRILQRLKVENIDIVENGLEACKKEAIETYDIVFMDQQMPVMGGVTACKEILSRPGDHVRPTIIFVTAHVSNDFERECMDAGGSGFIPKPFKLDVIEQSLQKFYKQRLEARSKRKRKTNELYISSLYR